MRSVVGTGPDLYDSMVSLDVPFGCDISRGSIDSNPAVLALSRLRTLGIPLVAGAHPYESGRYLVAKSACGLSRSLLGSRDASCWRALVSHKAFIMRSTKSAASSGSWSCLTLPSK
jgi:hypothetical protein